MLWLNKKLYRNCIQNGIMQGVLTRASHCICSKGYPECAYATDIYNNMPCYKNSRWAALFATLLLVPFYGSDKRNDNLQWHQCMWAAAGSRTPLSAYNRTCAVKASPNNCAAYFSRQLCINTCRALQWASPQVPPKYRFGPLWIENVKALTWSSTGHSQWMETHLPNTSSLAIAWWALDTNMGPGASTRKYLLRIEHGEDQLGGHA